MKLETFKYLILSTKKKIFFKKNSNNMRLYKGVPKGGVTEKINVKIHYHMLFPTGEELTAAQS